LEKAGFAVLKHEEAEVQAVEEEKKVTLLKVRKKLYIQ